MQFAELLDGYMLFGREPGVVLDERVAMVADLEGKESKDPVDEAGAEGLVDEAEAGLDHRRRSIRGEEVGKSGFVFQVAGEFFESATYPLAVLDPAFAG
jgi:hypothetical protein